MRRSAWTIRAKAAVCLLLPLCLVFGCRGKSPSPEGASRPTLPPPPGPAMGDRYRSDVFGFSIYGPAGWVVDDSGIHGSRLAIGGPREQGSQVVFYVDVEPVGNMNLAAYIASLKQSDPLRLDSFRWLADGPAPRDIWDGWWVLSDFLLDGAEVRCERFIRVQRGQAWVLSFTAPLPVFNRNRGAFHVTATTFELR